MSREEYREREYEKENNNDNDFVENVITEETEEKKEERPRSSAKRKTADETAKKKMTVFNTKLLNVRSTPENAGDDNIVGQLKENDIVETLGKENGYYKIKYKREDAYILSDFCKEV